mmetsp:Transcript_100868/g.262959  ORF Transcript_100868/g.262959 Transcript_100868/m.262959 type:complete len:597 (+) Transcript_100868:176-1966(+)
MRRCHGCSSGLRAVSNDSGRMMGRRFHLGGVAHSLRGVRLKGLATKEVVELSHALLLLPLFGLDGEGVADHVARARDHVGKVCEDNSGDRREENADAEGIDRLVGDAEVGVDEDHHDNREKRVAHKEQHHEDQRNDHILLAFPTYVVRPVPDRGKDPKVFLLVQVGPNRKSHRGAEEHRDLRHLLVDDAVGDDGLAQAPLQYVRGLVGRLREATAVEHVGHQAEARQRLDNRLNPAPDHCDQAPDGVALERLPLISLRHFHQGHDEGCDGDRPRGTREGERRPDHRGIAGRRCRRDRGGEVPGAHSRGAGGEGRVLEEEGGVDETECPDLRQHHPGERQGQVAAVGVDILVLHHLRHPIHEDEAVDDPDALQREAHHYDGGRLAQCLRRKLRRRDRHLNRIPPHDAQHRVDRYDHQEHPVLGEVVKIHEGRGVQGEGAPDDDGRGDAEERQPDGAEQEYTEQHHDGHLHVLGQQLPHPHRRGALRDQLERAMVVGGEALELAMAELVRQAAASAHGKSHAGDASLGAPLRGMREVCGARSGCIGEDHVLPNDDERHEEQRQHELAVEDQAPEHLATGHGGPPRQFRHRLGKTQGPR